MFQEVFYDYGEDKNDRRNSGGTLRQKETKKIKRKRDKKRGERGKMRETLPEAQQTQGIESSA